MKKLIRPILFSLVIVMPLFVSSCEEETVQPAKDGNITGVDDWHNE